MKRILPLAAALALALSACNREAPVDAAPVAEDASPVAEQPVPETPAAPAPAAPVEPAPSAATDARFDGYGDMRFGMTADEAKQAWGGELKGIPAEGEACYHLSPQWVKVPAEFAFMIEGGKFVRYSTESDEYVAPGGGKRGMSAQDIRGLYPDRVEETPHKYTDGKYLRIKDTASNGVLVFETDAAGKVTSWRVGVAPQVDYVEGCS